VVAVSFNIQNKVTAEGYAVARLEDYL